MRLQPTIIMPPSRRKDVRPQYDQDISIAASLEDFASLDESRDMPPVELPSQHSGFRSSSVLEPESEADSPDSGSPWSPPAWRKPPSGWLKHGDRLAGLSVAQSYESPPSSRQSSSLDPDFTLPTEVPLPRTPSQQRSPSPDPEISHEDEGQDTPRRGAQDSDIQGPNNCRSLSKHGESWGFRSGNAAANSILCLSRFQIRFARRSATTY